jgi:hypothetical protein
MSLLLFDQQAAVLLHMVQGYKTYYCAIYTHATSALLILQLADEV